MFACICRQSALLQPSLLVKPIESIAQSILSIPNAFTCVDILLSVLNISGIFICLYQISYTSSAMI